MTKKAVSATAPWGLSTEEFFYFFMGVRKGEIRKEVKMMRERFPEDSPRQLARGFVAAQRPLSVLGGALLHVPLVVPGLGPMLKLAGIATGSTVMIRLNVTLLLQIALLYGHDIDDRARIKEMFTIIAASVLTSSSSLLSQLVPLWDPRYRAVLGGVSVLAANQLIGEAAIRYYGRKAQAGIGLQNHGLDS